MGKRVSIKNSKTEILSAYKDLQKRTDGWENIVTGMGILGQDKKTSTVFKRTGKLTEAGARKLYEGEGFAKRIVDLPTNDMTREGFTISGDVDGDVLNAFDELDIMIKLRTGLRWGKVFGGGLGVLLLDDGGALEEELNIDNLRNIEGIHIFNRWRTSVLTKYNDPEKANFTEAEIYNVSPVKGAGSFDVHESRTIRFSGSEVSELTSAENQGWGDSVYRSAYRRIKGLASAFENVESIIEEFILGILTIEGLAELIASGEDEIVQKRLLQFDKSKHLINSALVDSGEKFEKISSSVSGLADLIDRVTQALSAVTGIPTTLLMGQSPKGLSATGESDIKFYYDMISSQQEEKLKPAIDKIIKLIMLSSESPTKGTELENWCVKFNPLFQPTEKEIAETRGMQAKSDDLYIGNGVLTAEEVANSRFGGETYSFDTSLQYERPTEPIIEEPGPDDDNNIEDED